MQQNSMIVAVLKIHKRPVVLRLFTYLMTIHSSYEIAKVTPEILFHLPEQAEGYSSGGGFCVHLLLHLRNFLLSTCRVLVYLRLLILSALLLDVEILTN